MIRLQIAPRQVELNKATWCSKSRVLRMALCASRLAMNQENGHLSRFLVCEVSHTSLNSSSSWTGLNSCGLCAQLAKSHSKGTHSLNSFCKPCSVWVKSKWWLTHLLFTLGRNVSGWTHHADVPCISWDLQKLFKGNVFPLSVFCKLHHIQVKSKLIKAI